MNGLFACVREYCRNQPLHQGPGLCRLPMSLGKIEGHFVVNHGASSSFVGGSPQQVGCRLLLGLGLSARGSSRGFPR
jgi:hypothetical protein